MKLQCFKRKGSYRKKKSQMHFRNKFKKRKRDNNRRNKGNRNLKVDGTLPLTKNAKDSEEVYPL
jgi:hypothetical protein